MNPLRSLEREHRVLLGLVDALESWADGLLRTKNADRNDLRRFMNVVVEFADVAHHEKEEDILLPLLFKSGLDWDTGPLRHVRDEHDQERYLTRVIQQAVSQEDAWSDEDRRHLLATIEAYVSFQRKHMKQEDEILYPVAHAQPEETKEALSRKLAEYDERFGRERYEALVEEAEALCRKYGAMEYGA